MKVYDRIITRVAPVIEYDEVVPEFKYEQYQPNNHVNGEIPTDTQSISNRKETFAISLKCTYEFLWVKVNSGKTPLFPGIIKFNEPLEKLSAGQPN